MERLEQIYQSLPSLLQLLLRRKRRGRVVIATSYWAWEVTARPIIDEGQLYNVNSNRYIC